MYAYRNPYIDIQALTSTNTLFFHEQLPGKTLQHTATHCNTLQHTATHCNTLQHTATHCTRLHHTAPHCTTLQHSCSDIAAPYQNQCQTPPPAT